MNDDEQDDLIEMIDETIKELQALVDYVKQNPHKEWCKGIDLQACEFKLKYQRAALKETTAAAYGLLPF